MTVCCGMKKLPYAFLLYDNPSAKFNTCIIHNTLSRISQNNCLWLWKEIKVGYIAVNFG